MKTFGRVRLSRSIDGGFLGQGEGLDLSGESEDLSELGVYADSRHLARVLATAQSE